MVVIIALISLVVLPGIDFANLVAFHPQRLFLPYGVILFALGGVVAIPEMKEELSNNRELLKKAIIIGAVIPVAIYVLFSLVMVGTLGLNTTEIVTTGLSGLGPVVFFLGNVFAMLAMATSFLALGLALKEMYAFDYDLNDLAAWLATIIPALVLFFALTKSFVGIIGLTGGIAMGVEGILVVLMYQKAKKKGKRKPEYTVKSNRAIEGALMVLFFFGIVYTILNFIGVI